MYGGSLGGSTLPRCVQIAPAAQSGRPPPAPFQVLLLRLWGGDPPKQRAAAGGGRPPQAQISCCCCRGSTPQASQHAWLLQFKFGLS